MRLNKSSNKFIFVGEDSNANYGKYIMNDILQDIGFIESELNFLIFNKEDRLKVELIEHLESLEEKIKQTSNKLKQLNLDIKETFYSEVIKEKASN